MLSSPIVTVLLLIASNVFMTFAWYAHLRNLSDRPWYIAAVLSWGIALFYMRQPVNWNFAWAGLCLIGAAYFMFR